MSPIERLHADARKAEILKAALAVFAMKGFAATTTKELAASAGVSEALLYKHFPSKENMFKELGQLICQDTQVVTGLISRMPASTRSLVHGMYYLTRLVLQGPPDGANGAADGRQLNEFIQRLMSRSLLEDGVFATAFLETTFHPYLNPLQAWFEAARKSGDLHTDAASDRIAILFSHHILVGIRLNTLRKGELELMGVDGRGLLREAYLFNLRGIGLKDAAIRKYVDFLSLDHWFNGIFSVPIPEPVPEPKPSLHRSKK